ncbi:hypothetical protein EB118_10585 [bacterium]|nr:hypothetical protein [bacterium]NDD82698.1 hypothetical protein [bacterium]NDG30503.1 hypothetical protein [bacterium]
MKQLTIEIISLLEKGCTGIYKLSFNDKIYIGSSTSIKHRLKHHVWALKSNNHHNRTLQNLFNKYPDQGVFEIVELCSEDILLEREKWYIDTLKPYINHILDPVKLTRDDLYRQRLSEAGKKSFANGRVIHNKKRTYMYDLEGNYLQEFPDASTAAKFVNLDSPTMICNCCRGTQYSANNYRWSYLKLEKLPQVTKKYFLRKVDQYKGDTFVKTWDSISEAQSTLNINNIARAMKKGLTAGGYRWVRNDCPQ